MPLLFRNASFVSKEQLLFLYSLSSYCDMNTFCCSQHRSYNKMIPSYLHDRPQEFVSHCLERRRVALGSDLSGITCQGKGLFWVVSFTNNLSECYKVTLERNMKSQNAAAMAGAKQVICANISLQFSKNFLYDHSMHYHQYTLRALF